MPTRVVVVVTRGARVLEVSVVPADVLRVGETTADAAARILSMRPSSTRAVTPSPPSLRGGPRTSMSSIALPEAVAAALLAERAAWTDVAAGRVNPAAAVATVVGALVCWRRSGCFFL